MSNLLELRNLRVEVGGREVIKGVNLRVRKGGELHVLMGPNGAGKSTLLRALIGDPRYRVVKGSILFNGKEINSLKPYERAKLGIAIAYQNPPRVGVKLGYLLGKLCSLYGVNPNGVLKSLTEKLKVKHLYNRDLYHGFSGGEAKRTELLITMLQKPRLALLDEPDSGVDIDSLAVVGEVVNELVESGSSVLLVTHTGHVLRYVKRVDALHVMVDGRLAYSGGPEVLGELLELGYTRFLKGG